MLRTRLLTALIGIPIVVLLLYFGGVAFLLFIAALAVLGWREMDRLVQRSHVAADRLLGLIFILVALGEAFALAHGWLRDDFLRPLLTGLLVISLTLALYDLSEHPIANWSAAIATALYFGILLSHFILLRERADGLDWTLLAIGLTWVCDSMAYFVGSAIGAHKLWPRISPKKSWEGLAGGSIGVLAAGALAGPWLVGITWWQGLILGGLLAVADPFGDFVVSLFKRQAHLKDSGILIPGHGGILDRLDSLLFTVPVVFYFALIIVGG